MRGAATAGANGNRCCITAGVLRFCERRYQVFAYRYVVVMKSHKSLCQVA